MIFVRVSVDLRVAANAFTAVQNEIVDCSKTVYIEMTKIVVRYLYYNILYIACQYKYWYNSSTERINDIFKWKTTVFL